MIVNFALLTMDVNFADIFCTCFFSQNAYTCTNIRHVLPISVKQLSDFVISRGIYYRATSHMRSFAKIKPSRKIPNLQYGSKVGKIKCETHEIAKSIVHSIHILQPRTYSFDASR